MENTKIKIFTYGTLMKGGHNNYVLGSAKFICEAEIEGHLCFGLPYGYPMVVKAKTSFNNKVVGEIWEVDATQIKHLDYLEGYSQKEDDGLYLRREVVAKGTDNKAYKAIYYLWNDFFVEGSHLVPSGVKWNNKGKY